MRFDIDYKKSKTMATRLQDFIAASPGKLTRSSAIEAVAKMLGFNNSNEMAARINDGHTDDALVDAQKKINAYENVIQQIKQWRNDTPMTGEECYDAIQLCLNDRYPFKQSTASNTDQLVDARQAAAEDEFESYEFQGILEGANGWEHISNENQWSRDVFFQNSENPDEDSVRGHFTITFDPESADIIGTHLDQWADHQPAVTQGSEAAASAHTPYPDPAKARELAQDSLNDIRMAQVKQTAERLAKMTPKNNDDDEFNDMVMSDIPNSEWQVLHKCEEDIAHALRMDPQLRSLLSAIFCEDPELEGLKAEGIYDLPTQFARILVNEAFDQAEKIWEDR